MRSDHKVEENKPALKLNSKTDSTGLDLDKPYYTKTFFTSSPRVNETIIDFMSKAVIRKKLSKISGCQSIFSWLMTGQAHLLPPLLRLAQSAAYPKVLSSSLSITKAFDPSFKSIPESQYLTFSHFKNIYINLSLSICSEGVRGNVSDPYVTKGRLQILLCGFCP